MGKRKSVQQAKQATESVSLIRTTTKVSDSESLHVALEQHTPPRTTLTAAVSTTRADLASDPTHVLYFTMTERILDALATAASLCNRSSSVKNDLLQYSRYDVGDPVPLSLLNACHQTLLKVCDSSACTAINTDCCL
jgi:hypothetical protein